MKPVDVKLFGLNMIIQIRLWEAADRYLKAKDARWMFAFAHFRITQLINDTIRKTPYLFRDPDQLIRFNVSFATAFLAATANNQTPPWKKAFSQCARADFAETAMRIGCPVVPGAITCEMTDGSAVKACAIPMANAHINTDIVNSLKTIGCIDPHDYANILVFVEIGSKDAILKLHGRLEGPIYNYLKQSLLPLDKIWRNAAYVDVCRVPVPNVEQVFRDTVTRNTAGMMQIRPSVL